MVAGVGTGRRGRIASRHSRGADDGRKGAKEVRFRSAPRPVPQVPKPTVQIDYPKWTPMMCHVLILVWSRRELRIGNGTRAQRGPPHWHRRSERRRTVSRPYIVFAAASMR